MQAIPTRIAGAQIVRPTDSPDPTHRPESEQWSEAKPTLRTRLAERGLTSAPKFLCNARGTQSIRCVEGELFVVIVDARLDSPTFAQWQSFYLAGREQRNLVIPAGVALGWQVTSQYCEFTTGRATRGEAVSRGMISWNDPELNINWPISPTQLVPSKLRARQLSAIPLRFLPRMHLANTSDRPRRKNRPLKRRLAPGEGSCSPRERSPLSAQSNHPGNTQSPPMGQLPVRTQPRAVHAQQQNDTPVTENRILIMGSSGQLGIDLCRHLRQLGQVIGACREPDKKGVLPVPTRIDISRPASIREAIRRVRPNIIVNATALTNVDLAEKEPRLAQLVNATGPAIMADEALRIGAAIVHFCTDKVFDGSGDRPWSEEDTPNPLNQYGRTKLLGTQAIEASGVPHLILRTGWLYSGHGDNYVRSLIDLITYRNALTLASDYIGTPTSTDWLAQLTTNLLGRGRDGIANGLMEHGGRFHVGMLGYASRVEVADHVIAVCRQHALPIVLNKLQAASLDDLPSAALCPKNCRLDASKLATQFGLQLPRWQTEMSRQIGLMLGSTDMALMSVA